MTHKSPVSIMCSRRRSTRTSRLPAGVMPRARHWMRRSFTMRCLRVSLKEEPSILHIRGESAHGGCSIDEKLLTAADASSLVT